MKLKEQGEEEENKQRKPWVVLRRIVLSILKFKDIMSGDMKLALHRAKRSGGKLLDLSGL